MIIDYEFQNIAASRVYTKIAQEDKHGLWLNAYVGYGKTYIIGKVLDKLVQDNWFNGHSSVFPVLWITKVTAIEQTARVLYDEFKIDEKLVYVTNYDQFRARMGKIWVSEKTIIKLGKPEIKYVWNQGMSPKLFILDESQALKNEDTQQGDIFIAAGNIPDAYFIHVSATIFDRVAGAKAFVIHTRVPYTYGFSENAPMCEKHWPDFAKWISGPKTSPYQYNKEACRRLREYMQDYIVKVPKVKTEFKVTNSVQCVPISPEKKAEYNKALVEYIEAIRRILNEEPPNSAIMMLVAYLIFRKKAEILRVDELAEAANASIMAGKAPIIGTNFKITIAKIVEVLANKYGISRDKISLIWGGVSKPKKGKSTAGAMMDYESIENSVGDLDLGPQNRVERQREIDKFQDGQAQVAMFTFKAGGVALSLHHHKDGQLPREGYFATTYSAIELLQALGRNHRINSISNTSNTIILFKGTIEEDHVYPILLEKIKCIGELVGSREKWADITLAGEKYLKNKASGVLGSGEDEEEVDDGYFDIEEKEDKDYVESRPNRLLENGKDKAGGNNGSEKISSETIPVNGVSEVGKACPDSPKSSTSTTSTLLPSIRAKVFTCPVVRYAPLWNRLPLKRVCTTRAVGELCSRYDAPIPSDKGVFTYIEKPNGKKCLVRFNGIDNYMVAYEN